VAQTLAADTEGEHMIVVGDNHRLAAHTLAVHTPSVVDRTEAAYTAHSQGDNHPEMGSAIEDRLDSWNKVFDRSYVWFLP